MKRIVLIAAAAVLCCAMLSCSYADKLVGKWELVGGSERLESTPVSDVIRIELYEDGVCLLISESLRNFIWYSATDDTFTFNFGDFGFGIGYELTDDTLILGETQNKEGAVFERVD